MLPVNGALPRHVRSSGMAQDATKNRWQRCYVVSLTLFASALLATLVTFGVLNFLLNGVALPPVSSQTGLLQTVRQPEFVQQGPAAGTAQLRQAPGSNATSLGDQAEQQPAADAIEPPAVKPPPLVWHHPYDDLQGLYKLPEKDTSPRCQQSEICDGDHSCGPDKLGCVTSAEERKEAVRKAIAWAWEGYRCGHAWWQSRRQHSQPCRAAAAGCLQAEAHPAVLKQRGAFGQRHTCRRRACIQPSQSLADCSTAKTVLPAWLLYSQEVCMGA